MQKSKGDFCAQNEEKFERNKNDWSKVSWPIIRTVMYREEK